MEDRVAQLIATQMASLSESFATSMEVSFANIQSVIDDRLASYSNPSFSAPSQFRSARPLARDNRIPPCRAPAQDMVLGVR